eukprot:gene27789-20199_t
MVVLFLAALCLCFQTLVQSTSGRPAQHGAVESADGSVPNCHERASKSSAYDEARISAAVNELSDASSMHNPRFVMFFGQPRTGHSIVGSILDAHPQMAVANEFNALKQVTSGASGRGILKGILQNTLQCSKGRVQA